MSNLPISLVSHTRKVQNLYKRAIRLTECWYDRREVFRYHAVLTRKRFDDNRDVKDLRVAKALIAKAEEELFEKQHWHPRKFPESPGGTAYGRDVPPPDWVLDYWHPIEKAQYPEYFARREERKKEFIKLWQKQFGSSSAASRH